MLPNAHRCSDLRSFSALATALSRRPILLSVLGPFSIAPQSFPPPIRPPDQPPLRIPVNIVAPTAAHLRAFSHSEPLKSFGTRGWTSWRWTKIQLPSNIARRIYPCGQRHSVTAAPLPSDGQLKRPRRLPSYAITRVHTLLSPLPPTAPTLLPGWQPRGGCIEPCCHPPHSLLGRRRPHSYS